jgi:hypothetical protein
VLRDVAPPKGDFGWHAFETEEYKSRPVFTLISIHDIGSPTDSDLQVKNVSKLKLE